MNLRMIGWRELPIEHWGRALLARLQDRADRPPHLVGENFAIFSHAGNKTSGRQVSPTADDSVSAAKREPEAPERTGVAATDR